MVSGEIKPGATVVAMPSGVKTKVQSIVAFEAEPESAVAGDSMTITLEDEIDLSRGDMLVGEANPPSSGTEFQAILVWMHSEPLDPHKIYVLKHTTRTVRARINQIRYRVDINTLEHAAGDEARPERNRCRGCEDDAAAVLRSVPSESHHGKLHRDRSADERDRRRGNH